ncbi:hypothetical protein [Synechococcus sp. UW140]|uniref:hypothetical protein n=1 Tax=Synechococcus sp. UW140 TaxID=368503 RepID=UPI0031379576
MGVGLTKLQRWRRQFAGDKDGVDGRKGITRNLSQIVPDLADQGTCMGSERSFYRVLQPMGSCICAVETSSFLALGFNATHHGGRVSGKAYRHTVKCMQIA